MKIKKLAFGCALCLLFLFWAMPSFAADPIMPLAEVKPGMKGIAKTVIQGEKISTFDVQVVDIIPGPMQKNNLILIKVSGPVIEKTGGIAEGMSGSPVYVNGKVIGAIGYGWSLTDHTLGMVTPIEDMLKVLKLSDQKATVAPKMGKPLMTPLLVNGLEGRALEKLTKELAPFNLRVVKGNGSGKVETNGALKPGSAVGVQFVQGYIDAGAVGTVTYVDKDRILAFGHPFLNKGKVEFPLTTAYVHQVVPSLDSSFKLASVGQTVGSILQDRTAGIAGVMKQKTPLTLVRMQVTDHDLDKTERLYFRVIKDRDLAGPLIVSSLLGLMDRSLDRVGKGTSKVHVSFVGDGLKKDFLVRENMFYSNQDVSAVSLLEVAEMLDMVVNNVYNQVDLREIVLKVDVEEQRRTATVQQAVAKQKEVRPGDTAELLVTYLPYRGQALQKVIAVQIPKDTPEGPLNLNVYGGNLPPIPLAKIDLTEAAMITPAPLPYENLEQMLGEFLKTDKNNEIIVEEMQRMVKPGEEQPERAMEKEKKLALGELRDDTTKLILPMKAEGTSKIKSIWGSPYIMEGYANVTIMVKK